MLLLEWRTKVEDECSRKEFFFWEESAENDLFELFFKIHKIESYQFYGREEVESWSFLCVIWRRWTKKFNWREEGHFCLGYVVSAPFCTIW